MISLQICQQLFLTETEIEKERVREWERRVKEKDREWERELKWKIERAKSLKAAPNPWIKGMEKRVKYQRQQTWMTVY